MKRRHYSWPGRADTLALIKAAAENGVEIELADHPGFRFIPNPEPRTPRNEPPSTRRLSFKRKRHMAQCKSWSPAALVCGPEDYRIPMAGDDYDLTEARGNWSEGDPGPLRELLARREWLQPAVELQEAA